MEIKNSKKPDEDDELPQCRIKRNYSCNQCTYFTQNPRFHLTHLRDIHGERIAINKCNLCLYASRHYQKLLRHMKMVHGSIEGIAEQTRKRPLAEHSTSSPQQDNVSTPSPPPPLVFSSESTMNAEDISTALELSRKTLKDIAVLYFAENEIENILAQMEADDVALVASAENFLKTKTLIQEDEGKPKSPCGQVSQCFSEALANHKSCNRARVGHSQGTLLWTEATKCPSCFHICKSSADLAIHLKNCLQHEEDNMNDPNGSEIKAMDLSVRSKQQIEDEMVTDKPQAPNNSLKDEQVLTSSHKKIFKCPRCSFWASTASRFHVHIVGHLNKKPFKCSLCSYRSNWRWDITKHIRLKSTRNPCHKNARVLMSDDAGRRNYTKYDKYMTLMKINNEDEDVKLAKTGEITLKQEATLECLKKSLKAGSRTNKSDKELIEKKHPSVRPCDDLITDTRTDRTTLYKCRRCFFRHANRDAVLAHVKMHYQNPDLSTSSSAKSDLTSNKDLSAITCTKKQDLNSDTPKSGKEDANRGKMSNSSNNLKLTTTSSTVEGDGQQTSRTASLNRSPFVGDISKSSMLMGDITAPKFHRTVSQKKPSSSFRCGLCYQVSSWKHVIQRHCRLKHSGDIRIEWIDHSSDSSNPTYRPLDFGVSEQQCHLKPDKPIQEAKKAPDREPSPKNAPDCDQADPSQTKLNNLQSNDPSKGDKSPSVNKTKQCPYCPFESDSPELFQRHIQQHLQVSSSQTAHFCDHCDFSTSTKDDLKEHVRIHFGAINKSSADFYTSFNNLHLNVLEDGEKTRKVGDTLMTKTIHFKSQPRAANIRRQKCSNDASKGEKKPKFTTTCLKTILVNPKTGQVIQRH